MTYNKLNSGSYRRHQASSLALLLVLLALNATPLQAQTTSTEILGTVSDQSGAVIAGAKVTMLRVATGEKLLDEHSGRRLVTDETIARTDLS